MSRCTRTRGPPDSRPHSYFSFSSVCLRSAPGAWSGSTESLGGPRRGYTVTGRRPRGPASRTSASAGPCRPPSKLQTSFVSYYVSGPGLVFPKPFRPATAVVVVSGTVVSALGVEFVGECGRQSIRLLLRLAVLHSSYVPIPTATQATCWITRDLSFKGSSGRRICNACCRKRLAISVRVPQLKEHVSST